MHYELQLAQLSDDALLHRLHSLVADSRRTEGNLVAHIGEVDARRLYAREASPSMHVYCIQRLRLSEAEAYLRITAARSARRYPAILEMLTDGRIHLSGISRLAPHLNGENHSDLLTRATHKTRRQIEEIVAEIVPRPDVPTVVRKLPARSASETDPAVLEAQPVLAASGYGAELCPDRARASVPSEPPARLEALAPARYKVQFTVGAGFRDKLERLQALQRCKFPAGDLAQILEDAVTEKLERLEARRFAKTARPRTDDLPKDDGSRYLPAALRRAVNLRDGDQCRFVDADGQRCPERHRLEYHHEDPYAKGGARSLRNIFLMCRTHNQHLAERDYGRQKVEGHRNRGARDGEFASSIRS